MAEELKDVKFSDVLRQVDVSGKGSPKALETLESELVTMARFNIPVAKPEAAATLSAVSLCRIADVTEQRLLWERKFEPDEQVMVDILSTLQGIFWAISIVGIALVTAVIWF